MADEWVEYALGELVDIYDGPHATPAKSSAGPVFLGISNLAQGRLDVANTEYLSEEDFQRWTRRVTPKAGDVVFSYETRLGEAAMIPHGLRCCLGRRMGLLRSRDGRVDMRFLLYAYLGPDFQETLRSRTIHGSTVDRIPLIEMPQFPIRVPESVDEQRAIARILGTLDDKIELNRRMNETLEATARALFKSWFVDFDPVRAKAESRDPGLPKSIAGLFPDSFEGSELGEIPKGWWASVLGEEVKRCGGRIQTGPFGSQLHASDYVADGVPVVMPKDLFQRRVSTVSIARVGLSDAQRLSRHRLQEGDIVYSRRGDVERHGLVRSRETGWLCGTGCLLVRLGAGWPSPLFASIALDRPETRAWIVQHAIGATMPNLNTGILARVPIVVPPDEVLRAFNRVVQPLADGVIAHDAQSETLASLRDTLLPQLISGELRVKDAEQIAEIA
jgi:type I restriction enzyme S subunit